MKNIFIVFVSFLLFSCSKQQERVVTYYYGIIHATENLVTGARMTTTSSRLNATNNQSISITAYTNTGYFFQTGFHNSGFGTVAFSQVWYNGVQVNPPLTLINAPSTFFSIGQVQTFGFFIRGDSIITTIDNHECLAFYLPCSSFNNVELYTEATSQKFPLTNFNPAIEINNNGWTLSQAATCSRADWGVEGTVQQNSLAVGEVNFGGGIKTKPVGLYVWNNNLKK